MSTALAPKPTTAVMTRVMGQLSAKNARVRELGKLEKLVMTPVETVGYGVAGGAADGALRAYFDTDKAQMGSGLLGVGAIMYGSVNESPAAVTFGVGVLSALASRWVENTLSGYRNGEQSNVTREEDDADERRERRRQGEKQAA